MAKARKGFKQMNDRVLDNKIRRDAARVKKDLSTLIGDSATRLSRLEGDFNQYTGKAKEDLTKWVGDGVSQVGDGVGKLASDARESMATTATSVKKDVGQRLVQYDRKAQEVADRAPGHIGEMARKYPWVAITFGLALGLLVGSTLSHARGPRRW